MSAGHDGGPKEASSALACRPQEDNDRDWYTWTVPGLVHVDRPVPRPPLVGGGRRGGAAILFEKLRKRLDKGFAKDGGVALGGECRRLAGVYYVSLRGVLTVARWTKVGWLGWSGRRQGYAWYLFGDERPRPDSYFDAIGVPVPGTMAFGEEGGRC